MWLCDIREGKIMPKKKKKRELDLDHVQIELSQVFNLVMHAVDSLSELLKAGPWKGPAFLC